MGPHELAEKRVDLANEYATLSEELGGILVSKASKWAQLRSEAKSDKGADRAWEATTEGIRETALRLKLKAYEKQLSSYRSMLDVLNAEARNLI